jgi:hypothetical protein
MRGVSPAQDDVSTASGAAAFLLMTPEHQDVEAMAITAEKARDVSELRITLDVLTSAERQDLANALLRAAWRRGPGGDPHRAARPPPGSRRREARRRRVTRHHNTRTAARSSGDPHRACRWCDGHCELIDHAPSSPGACARCRGDGTP